MFHAEICPICKGSGKLEQVDEARISKDLEDAGKKGLSSDSYSIPMKTETCHGCFGRGWVEVKDENPLSCYSCPAWRGQGWPLPYLPYPPPTIWYYTCSLPTTAGSE